MTKIEFEIKEVENILKALEMGVMMGHSIVSQEIKNIVSKEAYDKLTDIFWTYHNANYGPSHRYIKKKIEDAKLLIKGNPHG